VKRNGWKVRDEQPKLPQTANARAILTVNARIRKTHELGDDTLFSSEMQPANCGDAKRQMDVRMPKRDFTAEARSKESLFKKYSESQILSHRRVERRRTT
jgi:hypothetical protein